MHGIGHAVANYHLGDAFTNSGDNAAGLTARSPWEVGWWIGALATGDVGVIDSDGLEVNYCLAGFCCWLWNLFQL